MAKYNFRILLESIEGRKISYAGNGSNSIEFVDSSTDLVLSSSKVWNRITGSYSASYQNNPIFTGTFNTGSIFKENTLLSASLSGSNESGSISFIGLSGDYDRLLRYKFYGEKVCTVLGLPESQWVYVDQIRLPADEESNFFQGNIQAKSLFVSDKLTFTNTANLNSNLPILIDTGSDRHIQFIHNIGILIITI